MDAQQPSNETIQDQQPTNPAVEQPAVSTNEVPTLSAEEIAQFREFQQLKAQHQAKQATAQPAQPPAAQAEPLQGDEYYDLGWDDPDTITTNVAELEAIQKLKARYYHALSHNYLTPQQENDAKSLYHSSVEAADRVLAEERQRRELHAAKEQQQQRDFLARVMPGDKTESELRSVIKQNFLAHNRHAEQLMPLLHNPAFLAFVATTPSLLQDRTPRALVNYDAPEQTYEQKYAAYCKAIDDPKLDAATKQEIAHRQKMIDLQYLQSR